MTLSTKADREDGLRIAAWSGIWPRLLTRLKLAGNEENEKDEAENVAEALKADNLTEVYAISSEGDWGYTEYFK